MTTGVNFMLRHSNPPTLGQHHSWGGGWGGRRETTPWQGTRFCQPQLPGYPFPWLPIALLQTTACFSSANDHSAPVLLRAQISIPITSRGAGDIPPRLHPKTTSWLILCGLSRGASSPCSREARLAAFPSHKPVLSGYVLAL